MNDGVNAMTDIQINKNTNMYFDDGTHFNCRRERKRKTQKTFQMSKEILWLRADRQDESHKIVNISN